MKKMIPMALMAVALVGCDDVPGTIQVETALPLKLKKGEMHILQKGSHYAKFDYDEDDSELEIKIKVNGKEKKAELKIPAGMNVPTYRGPFELTGAQTGQAFDLKGNVDTDTDVSGPHRGQEACTWYTDEYRCRRVRFKDNLGNWVHREECGTERVPHYGRREYEYSVTTTTVKIEAEMSDVNLGKLASFSGSQSQSQTSYSYHGPCR